MEKRGSLETKRDGSNPTSRRAELRGRGSKNVRSPRDDADASQSILKSNLEGAV